MPQQTRRAQYTTRQAGTRKMNDVLGLSPCKPSKVAMLRNNLVGMLIVESRGWSQIKVGDFFLEQ